jgi:K+-sensing histidine kinase KdpD
MRRSASPGHARSPMPEATLRLLSHDLRTPLNAILGNLELLLAGSIGPLAPPVRACLGDVQLAARELAARIRSLLLLVEAVGGEARPAASTEVEVVALVSRHLEQSGRAAGRIELVPASAQLVLRGDRAWLEAMAETLAEIVSVARPRGSRLVLALERPAAAVRLRVGWEAFDPLQLPVVAQAVLRAMVELHGGALGSDGDRGLILDWPKERVVDNDERKAQRADASSHERG